MEVKANTNRVQVATKLALVTILGFFALTAKAANLNPQHAQDTVNKTFQKLLNSREIGAYQGTNRSDRWDVMCYEDCNCLSRHFSADLRAAGFETRRMYITPKPAGLNLHIRGTPSDGITSKVFWSFHWITIVKVAGGWKVVDPSTIRSSTLEPLPQWFSRIEGPFDERMTK